MSDTADTLPAGWTVAAIEDLFCPLVDGRTLHQGWSPQCEKHPAPTDEEWGVLKTTAIQAGAFLPQHNKRLPKHLTPRPQIEVKAGDLLITCAGPRVRCGVACLVRSTRPRLLMSGKMYRFRVSPDHMDPRYVEAFLQTPEAQAAIDKMKTGGSDSGLNLTHDRFRPLPVRVAPLNEQRRIMDFVEELLSDLDAGVAGIERVLAKLGQYRAAVLKAAVEGALTADWRKNHRKVEPASALLTRILVERRRRWEQVQLRKFKEAGKEPPKNWKAKYKEPAAPDMDDLPQVPSGWVVASMDALTSRITSGSRDWQQYYGTGTGTFVMAQNVRPSRLDLRNRQAVDPPPDDTSCERSKVEQGDLLVTIVGANTGDVCRVPEPVLNHYVCQSVALMRPVEPATASYLRFVLQCREWGATALPPVPLRRRTSSLKF